MYFFILYPNGLSYCEDVYNILKNNFVVIKILELNIQNKDLDDIFFNYLYRNENKLHIQGKLRYMMPFFSQKCFKIKIILIDDEKEIFFNDRGKKKNKNIEMIKREIRNKFNPKFDDINKQIYPLEKGVSHNHVIHSNDTPEEYKIIENIIIKYKKYNIIKADTYHHKNDIFLNYFINKHHNVVNNLNDADIILSAAKYIGDTHNFKNKKFIFGPHFGKGRINEMRTVNNKYSNNIYIQPSLPSVKLWTDELKFTTMPVKAMPFGVDTDKFKPDKKNNITENKLVFLYYKDRDPAELNYIEEFLKKKNINYKIFSYLNRYQESDYLHYLKKAKYGIWLGTHESQGYALQEALSCNVPLLVWNVTQRHQQWSSRHYLVKFKTNVTTMPYWHENCGEFFYNQNEFESKYDEFISKLDTYKPRKFILDNLSMEKCVEKWNKLFLEL